MKDDAMQTAELKEWWERFVDECFYAPGTGRKRPPTDCRDQNDMEKKVRYLMRDLEDDDDLPTVDGYTLGKIVHRLGGVEGGGEDVERVIEVLKGGKVALYLKIDGYYSSDEGTTWNESVDRVYPRQVTVTQWFATETADA